MWLPALYSNICFCLVWERYSGLPELQVKAGASHLPSSCREKNVYLGIVLVLQILGWTQAHCFCAVPLKIAKDRQELGAPTRSATPRLPVVRCKAGEQPARRRPQQCRKPPPRQQSTKIRNTPTQKFLSQANGVQITHRVCFGFLFFFFCFFFKRAPWPPSTR